MKAPNHTAVLTLQFVDEQLPLQTQLAHDRRLCLQRIANHIEALQGGTRQGTVTYIVDGGSGVAASGTITIASGSGSIAAIINGVTISVTWATSDTNTAALLATAINASANALVAPFVGATSALGVVTITADNKGVQGNTITLAASGTGATASGARLTGGVNATTNTVTI